MVDTSSGIDRLPPVAKLRELRRLEEERRKELEEELARKKRELDELEKRGKQELEETESLEADTLEEIAREREREIEDLEQQIGDFRKRRDFVEEGIEEVLSGEQEPLYGAHHAEFHQAQQNLSYLLNATPSSEETRIESERGLYQAVRSIASGFNPADEGYAVQQLQEQVQKLKERGGEDAFGYVGRIENVLNSIIDYRKK